MAGSDVIADVSRALQTALGRALANLAVQVIIHDLQNTTVPPIPTNPPSLVIFLYRLIEDPSIRNRHKSPSTSPIEPKPASRR